MLFPLAFQMPGFGEMLLIAGLGLLFFGKRLPEVGRSLGKGIVEFKKGIKGIEDDVEVASGAPSQRTFSSQPQVPAQQPGAAAYRFDPYTGKPVEQNQPSQQVPPAQ
ncbi:hypothetical protein BH09PLA1_BH09PLA1_26240 [soil metagenome]